MCPSKEEPEDQFESISEQNRNIIITTIMNLIRLTQCQRRRNEEESNQQNKSNNTTIEEESDDDIPELE